MKKAALALAYFAVIIVIVILAGRRDSQFLFEWVRAVPGLDKVGHFLAIGGLSFVVNYGLSCRKVKLGNRPVLLGSVLVFAFTTMEEVSQVFIRYRTFDFVDLVFDFAGICVFGKLAQRAVKTETVPK